MLPWYKTTPTHDIKIIKILSLDKCFARDKIYKELSVGPALLEKYDHVEEVQEMSEQECEFICQKQEFMCNFYIYSQHNQSCTWGKTDCQHEDFFHYTGADAVLMYLKKDDSLCPVVTHTISLEDLLYYTTATEEEPMRSVDCQYLCSEHGLGECNFIYYNSSSKLCSWGKVNFGSFSYKSKFIEGFLYSLDKRHRRSC